MCVFIRRVLPLNVDRGRCEQRRIQQGDYPQGNSVYMFGGVVGIVSIYRYTDPTRRTSTINSLVGFGRADMDLC